MTFCLMPCAACHLGNGGTFWNRGAYQKSETQGEGFIRKGGLTELREWAKSSHYDENAYFCLSVLIRCCFGLTLVSN